MNPVSRLRFPKPQPFGSATTAEPAEESVLGPLTDHHIAALVGRGLDPELLVKLSVGSSAKLGDDALVIGIPYFDGLSFDHPVRVGCKHRTIAGEKRFAQDRGSRQVFYNLDCLRDPTLENESLIITEGEVDCWAALQAGFSKVVSVPGGAPSATVQDGSRKYAFLEKARPWIDACKTIILAVDDDAPGIALRQDLSARLGAHRCQWVQYPKGCKDLGDALKLFGTRGVIASLNRAQPMRIEGYFEMDDLPEVDQAPALDCGMVGLGEHYRLRRGDFCVVTGAPGSGKSSFLNELCGRMAKLHGWKTIFASFEQQTKSDHRRALRSFHAEKLERDMTVAEKQSADAWINKSFGFIVPPPETDPTVPWMLTTCRSAVLRKEAHMLVIDPWNELSHQREEKMSLTEYTGEAIKEWKRFARDLGIHLVIAAHPAKPRRLSDGKFPFLSLWDISDSAHWANKPDVGIVIHRADMKNNETVIRVVKSRYSEIGRPGEIKGAWNINRTRYTITDDGATA